MILLSSYNLSTYIHSTLVNNVDELITLLQKETAYRSNSEQFPRVIAKKDKKGNIYILYLHYNCGTYVEIEVNGQFNGKTESPSIPWQGNKTKLTKDVIENGDYIILVGSDGRKRNTIRFQRLIDKKYRI